MKIYLAIPFSSALDKELMDLRFELANEVSANLLEKGHLVYSPITASYPIVPYLSIGHTSFEFWKNLDFSFIEWAETVVIVCIPGWSSSDGISQEVKYAKSIGKTIKFLFFDWEHDFFQPQNEGENI